jgi:hypothetical protein
MWAFCGVDKTGCFGPKMLPITVLLDESTMHVFFNNEKKYSTFYSKMRKTTLIQKSYANDPIDFTYKFISSHNPIHEIKGHSKGREEAHSQRKVGLEPKPIRFLNKTFRWLFLSTFVKDNLVPCLPIKGCYFSVYAKKSNKSGLRVGFRQLGSYKSGAVKLHHDLGYVWLVETFFFLIWITRIGSNGFLGLRIGTETIHLSFF